MSHPLSIHEVDEWPLRSSRRESTVSSSTQSSGSLSFISSPPFTPSITPAFSPSSRPREGSVNDEVVRLPLHPAVTVSFIRNKKLFKLRYTFINIRKDFTGALKCLELGGGVGQQNAFLHSFNTTRLPVPHLEHPKLRNESSLRISFFGDQTIQTGTTVFATQLSYTFEEWEDCVQFQELVLASKLVFIAGIAEAKSKGRGEECISQNLRILRGHSGKLVLLFFANSQRKERKRYVSIPQSITPGKNSRRPVVLQLQPNFDILSEMKTLQIQFLDDEDQKAFCQFLAENAK
ncbi:hypothetical protein AOCH_006269 [Aspergillus ochraceoroseus]|uniref:Uncharacterized protein n=1 Tax=Aspergillus ochraceoroseus TaxID=138278 RepID=A0A0F8XLM0_9EURO|nr:hypothetical protein AOCH_006269 [Aspergillus ochraceoroseus]